MKIKTIRWRLMLSYGGIALLATLLLGSIMLFMVKRYYVQQEREYLQMNAKLITGILSQVQSADITNEELFPLIDNLAFISNLQIRVLDPDGNEIYDSGPFENSVLSIVDASSSGNGVIALQGGGFVLDAENDQASTALDDGVFVLGGVYSEFPGFLLESLDESTASVSAIAIDEATLLVRSNQTYDQAYAHPDGTPAGAIELSNGPAYGWFITRSVARGWAVAAVCATILAGLTGFLISRIYIRPLQQLTNATRQMADGDLSARAIVNRQDEFGVLAQTFNRMADHVETHIQSLHRFLSDASHELHTPLTVMRANLEMMDTEETRPVLEQVHRMASLTRNLLALSKLDTVLLKNGEKVNFRKIVQGLLDGYSSQAEQKGIEFKATIECSDLQIPGNSSLLTSAVRNLLDNAIKFTDSGGHIALLMWSTKENVHLRVSNNGIGIPADDLPQIFSRFHRGRNASSYEGSGLGLAIVKSIVDLHAGDVSVSQDDTWTAFEIMIPLTG